MLSYQILWLLSAIIGKHRGIPQQLKLEDEQEIANMNTS